jgi:hypothetical protein
MPLTELKYRAFCLLEYSRNCSVLVKTEVTYELNRNFPMGDLPIESCEVLAETQSQFSSAQGS